MDYENDHKDIFGLSVLLELKHNSDIQSHFSTSKLAEPFFFIEEYKKEANFYYRHIWITLIFNVLSYKK